MSDNERASVHDYRFDELVPVRALQNGINVYDRTSFKGDYEFKDYADPPWQPQIFLVDRMEVAGRQFGPSTILMFHGASENGKWVQFDKPRRPVEDIVRDVEAEGIGIDALFVCNPGYHLFPSEDGNARYSYALGTPQTSFHIDKKGKLYTSLKRNTARLQIKGEPQSHRKIQINPGIKIPDVKRKSIRIKV